MFFSLRLEYIGKNCNEDFDVCDGMCENGGSCLATAGGHYFECSCPLGYSGQRCEKGDILECPPDTCLNGGMLVPSGCSCVCPPGYTGERCETGDICIGLAQLFKTFCIP